MNDFLVIQYEQLKPLAVFRYQKKWWIKGMDGSYPLKEYKPSCKRISWDDFSEKSKRYIKGSSLIATNEHNKIRITCN